MRNLLFSVLFLAGCVLTSYAENPLSLVFQTIDGNSKSIDAKALAITFSDGNLIADNGNESLQFALTDLSRMYFSNENAGVDITIADFNQGPVKVYTTAGVFMGEFNSVAEASRQLPPATYVINLNDNKTLKIIVK